MSKNNLPKNLLQYATDGGPTYQQRKYLASTLVGLLLGVFGIVLRYFELSALGTPFWYSIIFATVISLATYALVFSVFPVHPLYEWAKKFGDMTTYELIILIPVVCLFHIFLWGSMESLYATGSPIGRSPIWSFVISEASILLTFILPGWLIFPMTTSDAEAEAVALVRTQILERETTLHLERMDRRNALESGMHTFRIRILAALLLHAEKASVDELQAITQQFSVIESKTLPSPTRRALPDSSRARKTMRLEDFTSTQAQTDDE